VGVILRLHIKRIWEHEIKKDLDVVVNDISNFIDKVKNQNKKP